MKANIEQLTEKTVGYGVEERLCYWQRIWVIVAAVWLEVIVLIFVVLRFSRLETPVIDWLDKTINLLLNR